MADSVRVMIQMRPTPAMALTSFGPVDAAPQVLALDSLPGVQLDADYSPVPVPPAMTGALMGFAEMTAENAVSTFIIRASVRGEALPELLSRAEQDPSIVGVFADPVIEPIGVCPSGPVGTDLDVEELLLVEELKARGMDGAGVRVVVVDTGVNLKYLRSRRKNPGFDAGLSWGPVKDQPLGDMRVGHGTMCAYDVCIAAPACTLVDHAVLTSPTSGGSKMDGWLSDAVKSYGTLLTYMTKAPEPFAGDHVPRTLVVNNSWGMYHQSWDFPVGDTQNYSDNPEHPFNIIVASLEAAGADILFAAGNCGSECPDRRCQGVTDAGIFGANSSDAVTCVAGVLIDKERVGYSTKGPGRLVRRKPDIASFTHFAGSGVYSADGGTSAATPVAAGVVAAIRRRYPASVLSPARLRELLRGTAEPRGGGSGGFNYEYGYGVIDVGRLVQELESLGGGGTTGGGKKSSKKASKKSSKKASKKSSKKASKKSSKRGGR